MTDKERLEMVRLILRESVLCVSETIERASGYAGRIAADAPEKKEALSIIEQFRANSSA